MYEGAKWPQEVHSLYWTFSKPFFLFGLILAVLPSCLGISHSFFNLILKGKVLVYIARISFCTYLVHLMVIYHVYFTRNEDVYYSLVSTFSLLQHATNHPPLWLPFDSARRTPLRQLPQTGLESPQPQNQPSPQPTQPFIKSDN